MAPDGRDDDPLRRAAQYRLERAESEALEDGRAETDPAETEPAETEPDRPARRRMDDRARWVDTVVDQAIRRGEFDDLPLQGKPIPGLKGAYDPDWWLKSLIEREQITGVLPPAQLRRDDAELDGVLDRQSTEEGVREVLRDFNARVIDARRQLQGGPPVVTPTRDVEHEVARWRERRSRLLGGARESRSPEVPDRRAERRRPWWRRRA